IRKATGRATHPEFFLPQRLDPCRLPPLNLPRRGRLFAPALQRRGALVSPLLPVGEGGPGGMRSARIRPHPKSLSAGEGDSWLLPPLGEGWDAVPPRTPPRPIRKATGRATHPEFFLPQRLDP